MILLTHKNFFKFIIGIATSLLIASCSYDDSSVKEDVLVYCSEGSPETFNPQLSTSGTTFDASSRVLYNRLVEFKPKSTLVEPALAERYSISKDGKVYTFYLRKDVKFHSNKNFTPTRNFNADDVLFSFQRQSDFSHPFHHVSSLSFRYFETMGLHKLIKSIKKLDDHTIQFTLTKPNSPFLATLAMDFASILSAEYAQHLTALNTPELIDTQPIGTGPFQLERYQPDAFIRYKANPNFWQQKIQLKQLVFAITPTASLRFSRTLVGECDVMANPLPIHIEVAKEKKEMLIFTEPSLNIAFLSMNTTKAPFDDPLVRKAINYAIDKKSILKKVYLDTAVPAVNPIPPSIWSYNETISDFNFNPEFARSLLSQTNYPNGFDMTIWTMSAQRAYNPNAKKMAELIQQDLKRININVTISTFEFGTFLSKTRRGEHHSALMGWNSDNGDPDNFFMPLLSCSGKKAGTNSAFWCSEKFSNLLQQARYENDLDKRKSIYQQAQIEFKKNSPWVPIAHATRYIIINPRVKNFQMNSIGGINFKNVYLEKSNQSNQDDIQ